MINANTIFVLFGATGDLATDYLFPEFVKLSQDIIKEQGSFKLICVSRRPWDTAKYVDFISGILKQKGLGLSSDFIDRIVYYAADFDLPNSFNGLAEVLADEDDKEHVCHNRLFYFATPPRYFEQLSKILDSANLINTCAIHYRSSRVLIEKPFGEDLKSAKKLNKSLLSFFREDQVYRIDHYLAKETVQNLLVLRFANDVFESLWSNEHIDRIEICAFESERVNRQRAVYYDSAGATKDFLQNHLLHMMTLLLMERPKAFISTEIAKNKLTVLKSIKPYTKKSAKESFVFGQYDVYERDIDSKSNTETFVSMRLEIANSRFKGVPIFLRTGKAFSKKEAYINVYFKQKKDKGLFGNVTQNKLSFNIQPEETVAFCVNNKVPGFGMELAQGCMMFSLAQSNVKMTAYERLLIDFIQGDQSLFISSKEIEEAWKIVDNIIEYKKTTILHKYETGGSVENVIKQFDI